MCCWRYYCGMAKNLNKNNKMTKLIYHKIDKINDTSPFDSAIIELVTGKKIKIACPYISIYYLEKIIRLSDGWKLITDINEWIYSGKTNNRINNIINFIDNYKLNIRHFPSLHAKTIISNHDIFLGSSNLTDKGIFKKNELSVIISDIDIVKELNDWFDEWWNNSNIIQIADLKEMSKNIPKFEKSDKLWKARSTSPKINTTTVPKYSKSNEGYNILPLTETGLISYLQKWNNNKWEYDFFKLLQTAINLTPLKKESKYLAVTLNKKMQINFQINNRIVLRSHSSIKKNCIAIILPLEFEKIMKNYPNIHKIEYFTDHKKIKQALLVRFIFNDLKQLDSTIYDYWKLAIGNELNRKFTSPYKRYHQNIIYDVAIDEIKLNELFAAINDK